MDRSRQRDRQADFKLRERQRRRVEKDRLRWRQEKWLDEGEDKGRRDQEQ